MGGITQILGVLNLPDGQNYIHVFSKGCIVPFHSAHEIEQSELSPPEFKLHTR